MPQWLQCWSWRMGLIQLVSQRFVIKWFFPLYLCRLTGAEKGRLRRVNYWELCWYLSDRNSDFQSQHSSGVLQQSCPGSMGNDHPLAFMQESGTTSQSLDIRKNLEIRLKKEVIVFWQFQGAQPEWWSGLWHLTSLAESLVGAKVKCSPEQC